jgi:hypothetical protein
MLEYNSVLDKKEFENKLTELRSKEKGLDLAEQIAIGRVREQKQNEGNTNGNIIRLTGDDEYEIVGVGDNIIDAIKDYEKRKSVKTGFDYSKIADKLKEIIPIINNKYMVGDDEYTKIKGIINNYNSSNKSGGYYNEYLTNKQNYITLKSFN